MSKEKSIFTKTLVLKVLYDNSLEKLTLEEISKEVVKEVVKEVGKETTILTTNDATELKRILHHMRQNKHINLFNLGARVNGYQITTSGQEIQKTAQEIILKEKKPLTVKNLTNILEHILTIKLFQEKTAQVKNPLDMNHQEKIAYYYSQEFTRQKYLSREEYKKNKKYIYKKEWVPSIGGVSQGYSRRTMAERKGERREWLCILITLVAIFLIFVIPIVVIFFT